MAEDLVTRILQGLSSGTMDQVSSAVGIDRTSAQNAMSGIVPSVLAGLVGLVSRPGGPDRLSSLIAPLGNLGTADGALRTDNLPAMREQGASLLTSLFGGQTVEALVGAVAQYMGASQGTAGKLLGLSTPLILGLLGRHAQSAGGGARGLASMLLDQKDAIAGALPPGLAAPLQGSGMLSGIADRLTPAAAGARSAASSLGQGAGAAMSSVSDFSTSATQSVPGGGGGLRWLYALGAAIILAIGAYWLWGTGSIQEANLHPAVAPAQTEGSGTSVAVGTDLVRQLTGTLDKTRSTLEQVTDAASAKQAVPQLEDMLTHLDDVRNAAVQAPAAQKRAMAEMITRVQPNLQDLMDKAMAKPGAAEVLKPTLDAVKSKLAALASA
jgi:Bacterial protein of unknown function (DUF937)